jgi:hypothetical protein
VNQGTKKSVKVLVRSAGNSAKLDVVKGNAKV